MKLTKRHLMMLQSCMPTEDEAAQLAPYSGKLVRSLAKADRYMCEISALAERLQPQLEVMILRHTFDNITAEILEASTSIIGAGRALVDCQAISGTLSQLNDMSLEAGLYGTLCTYDAGMLETLCMVGTPPAPANDQQIQACRAGARYDEREVLSMYAAFTSSLELLKQQTPSAPAEAKLADFSAKRVGVVDRIHEQMQQMNLQNNAVRLLFKVRRHS